MRKFCGFVAICGVMYAICGGVNPFIYLLTVLCGALYLFYPEEWLKE